MESNPKINNLVQSFTTLFEDLKEYHEQLAEEHYSDKHYQWLRPEQVQNLMPTTICEPYSLAEINQQGAEYIQPNMAEDPVRKDYAVLDYEMSLLQSFARAFHERHANRLRHFSHSAGVAGTINKEETGLLSQLYETAKKILEAM